MSQWRTTDVHSYVEPIFVIIQIKLLIKKEKMMKKRKRNAGLNMRKKHYTRTYSQKSEKDVRQTLQKDNIVGKMMLNSPSQEKVNKEKNIAHDRKSDQFRNERRYGFQHRQRIAIAFVYEHIYGELHPDEWKSFDLIHKIIKHLELNRSAHPMVK